MAAVIRMKRRVDEEPLNAFVLNCKRPKTEEPLSEADLQSTQTETSTILKFAGTISQVCLKHYEFCAIFSLNISISTLNWIPI